MGGERRRSGRTRLEKRKSPPHRSQCWLVCLCLEVCVKGKESSTAGEKERAFCRQHIELYGLLFVENARRIQMWDPGSRCGRVLGNIVLVQSSPEESVREAAGPARLMYSRTCIWVPPAGESHGSLTRTCLQPIPPLVR